MATSITVVADFLHTRNHSRCDALGAMEFCSASRTISSDFGPAFPAGPLVSHMEIVFKGRVPGSAPTVCIKQADGSLQQQQIAKTNRQPKKTSAHLRNRSRDCLEAWMGRVKRQNASFCLEH
jgi:hypothetical protein